MVIEHRVLVAVDVEKALRITDTEVLKVYKTVRVVFAHELHEAVYEAVISLASYPPVLPALEPLSVAR